MKKTVTLTEILNHLLHKENIRPSELARLTGVPQPTVHRMVTGTCPRPHKSSLQPIAEHFNISIEQLKGLEPIAGLNMHKLESADGWSTLPLVDWKHLSTWPKAEFDYQLTELGVHTQKREQTMTYADAALSNQAFAAYLHDRAMEPLFPADSLLIFDPQKAKIDGSYSLIRLENGNVLFRRLVLSNAQTMYTTVENPSSPIELAENDEIIGVLAQVRSDY